MKLKLIDFIKENSDWEALLSNKPFCLNITRQVWNNLNLVMFKYNQIESDFNESIVRECRGLILNEDTYDVVSYPFNKFGNVGEGVWVDNIDWNSAHVLEKCDGSIIKIVKVNGKLLISTNGCILASKCNISKTITESSLKNFEDLFYWAIKEQFPNFKQVWFEQLFEEGYTYIFELCTNANKIVVPHPEPKVYFIGIRNNKTYKEIYIFDHDFSKIFYTPKIFPLKTLDDVVNAASKLDWKNEGYVVSDKYFKRVKIKSPAYCATHHLKGNGVPSLSRCLEVFLANESNEILAYFPEFKSIFDEIAKKFNDFSLHINSLWSKFNELNFKYMSRKEQAIHIKSIFGKHSGIGFAFLDGKINTIQEHLKKCPIKNLIIMLGLSK